jgi:hypothetical protein
VTAETNEEGLDRGAAPWSSAGIESAISSGGVANHAKLLPASIVHGGAEVSQEQESSALATTACMPIRSMCRRSRFLRNQCIHSPLIHVLNVRLSLHQRPTDLAAASPFPILVLTIAIERLSSFVYRQPQSAFTP